MIPENNAYTIITGASSGIGKAIAKEMASRNHNLILHSLPDQGLSDFCAELETQNKIRAFCCEGDLASENGPEILLRFVKNKGLRVNILINNAGVGFEGPIEGYTRDQIDTMIFLNIRAVTLLTSFFTPELKSHKKSFIMNISSFGAYFPTAYKSVYLASKSYLYFFTRALESEMYGSSPNTCVVVPASVRTNKIVLDRIERNGWFSQKLALSPEKVAAIVVKGMFKRKKVIIPGKMSNLFFSIGLFVPEGIMMWLTRRIFANYRQ